MHRKAILAGMHDAGNERKTSSSVNFTAQIPLPYPQLTQNHHHHHRSHSVPTQQTQETHLSRSNLTTILIPASSSPA